MKRHHKLSHNQLVSFGYHLLTLPYCHWQSEYIHLGKECNIKSYSLRRGMSASFNKSNHRLHSVALTWNSYPAGSSWNSSMISSNLNHNAVFDTKVSVNLRARQNGKATVFRFSSGCSVRPVWWSPAGGLNCRRSACHKTEPSFLCPLGIIKMWG